MLKVILPIIICLLSLSFQASGFGKNKVQYSQLKWEYLTSPHFNIYFHQEQDDLPKIACNWIEQDYASLSKTFNFAHRLRIPLIIYGSPNLFEQTNIVTEILPEEVGGFTELFKTRIVVPFNGSYEDLGHVLHHELVHAFVYGILYNQIGNKLLASANQIPFWFMEGGAEYLSSSWDIEADMFLMDQRIFADVPPPGPLLDGYMAYKGGQSFLHFLNVSRGDSAFSNFLREFKQTRNVDNSVKKTYYKTTEELGKEWIQELKRIYWPEIGRRIDPKKQATSLISHLESKDNFNLRPRLSPDGKKVAFFSDRDDYTRILITDLKGKVLQEISQNGYGGYFESFHPFRSGICWSPDCNSIAFVTKNQGKDELRIVDVKNKKLKKTIHTGLEGVSSPDWSHNGKLIVFSGINKGFGDLFRYDLTKDTLERLTCSVEYEADPRFTHNDQEIIFSIQDTTLMLSNNPYGRYTSDLALMDLKSRKIRKLTNTISNEKQPCISPDGSKVLYVSDRNGLDNLYIGQIDSLQNSRPLTDYIGGCSNPDWSTDSCAAFCLFQNQGWDIWLMKSPLTKLNKDSLAFTKWVESCFDSTKHFYTFEPIINNKDSLEKPSKKRTKSLNSDISESSVSDSSKTNSIPSDSLIHTSVPKNMQKDTSTQNKTVQFTTAPPSPYHLRFSPDMIALGVGVDTYYGYAGQWLLSLSDLMGDHQITLSGDIQGNFKDYIHLYGSYLYLRKRIDLGIGGYYSKDYTYQDVFGEKIFHDTEIGAFLLATYPFSLFSRIDFEVFGRNIKRKPVTFDSSTTSSTVLLESLSYSFDNILWGITGPINGTRMDLTVQISPPMEFVTDAFLAVNADIRNYMHVAHRFVWANRLFAAASQPLPLDKGLSSHRYFLGGNENWLFYKVNVDEYEKNIPNTLYSEFVTPMRGWKYLDISGTRALLFNSEFRFPFIKELSVVWPLPFQIRYINGALFTDIGDAWDAGTRNKGLPFPKKLYGGFGFGMRANLGIFILRYDRGWPTDFESSPGTPINYFSLGAEF